MTALFSWKARPPKQKKELGQTRVVRKLLLMPKKLGGEWRWLGVEVIRQYCVQRWVSFHDLSGGYYTLVFVDREWML
jgi:hypothetical protein